MNTNAPRGSDDGINPASMTRRQWPGKESSLIDFVNGFSLAREIAIRGPAAIIGAVRGISADGGTQITVLWAWGNEGQLLHDCATIMGDVGIVEFARRMNEAFPASK